MHLDDRLTAAIDQKADKEVVAQIAKDVTAVKSRVSWMLGIGTAVWAGITAFLGIGD